MTTTTNSGRFAGWLYVLASIVGFFAMGYVPNRLIVHGDVAATVGNINAHQALFRAGIAAELVGQAAFIFVALALYDLLKTVHRRHASLMVTLIVVSIPIAFLNELNSIAALILLRGADFLTALQESQRYAFAMLFLNLHHYGFVVAEMFWGLWLFPLGRLVYLSRFLPKFLGIWLALAGVAWMLLSFTGILFPQYQSQVDSYCQPAFFGEIAFMLWLVIRGAHPPVLREPTTTSAPA
jgi:hypothetical protein